MALSLGRRRGLCQRGLCHAELQAHRTGLHGTDGCAHLLPGICTRRTGARICLPGMEVKGGPGVRLKRMAVPTSLNNEGVGTAMRFRPFGCAIRMWRCPNGTTLHCLDAGASGKIDSPFSDSGHRGQSCFLLASSPPRTSLPLWVFVVSGLCVARGAWRAPRIMMGGAPQTRRHAARPSALLALARHTLHPESLT